MNDKYITKEQTCLTRVTVEIDENKFIAESLYSDTDMRELAMQCIESALVFYRIDTKILIDVMKCIVKNDPITIDYKLLKTHNITIMMEQYENRHIVKVDSTFNLINSLLCGMRACAVLSTYLPESNDDFFREYIYEHCPEDESFTEESDDTENNDND